MLYKYEHFLSLRSYSIYSTYFKKTIKNHIVIFVAILSTLTYIQHIVEPLYNGTSEKWHRQFF